MQRLLFVLALITWLCAARYSCAQNTHIPLPPAVPQSQDLTIGSRPIAAPVTADGEIQKQQAIAANLQRQIEIKRDTEKMAELTQQLKQYMEKTERGVVSVDAIKKIEQVEKLAHSIKSKMKQSF
jgi:C4-dicarboxylate-specific signal transduction histidine kinase